MVASCTDRLEVADVVAEGGQLTEFAQASMACYETVELLGFKLIGLIGSRATGKIKIT
jgi:hypothetical protein